jgi:hypothetical protein
MLLNPDPICIRIRIHKSTLEDKFFQRLKNQLQKKSKILAVCLIFILFRYKNKLTQLKKYLFFLIFLPLDPDS